MTPTKLAQMTSLLGQIIAMLKNKAQISILFKLIPYNNPNIHIHLD